jgi:hypothetical protein
MKTHIRLLFLIVLTAVISFSVAVRAQGAVISQIDYNSFNAASGDASWSLGLSSSMAADSFQAGYSVGSYSVQSGASTLWWDNTATTITLENWTGQNNQIGILMSAYNLQSPGEFIAYSLVLPNRSLGNQVNIQLVNSGAQNDSLSLINFSVNGLSLANGGASAIQGETSYYQLNSDVPINSISFGLNMHTGDGNFPDTANTFVGNMFGVTAVPEPTTLALIIVGFLFLFISAGSKLAKKAN